MPGWVAVRQKQLTLPSSPYIHIVVVRIVLYPINSCLVDRRACPVQFSSLCVAGHCRRLAFFLFLFSCSFDISQPLLSSSIYNPPQTLTHESSSTIAYYYIFSCGVLSFSYRPHITEGETRLGFTPAKTRGTTGSHHTCQRAPFNLVLYYIACCAYLFCLFFSSSPLPFLRGVGGGGGRQFLQMI